MNDQSHRTDSHPDHVHGSGCGHDAVQHGDHVDYMHGGHRHAEHAEHWDEHGEGSEGSGDRDQGTAFTSTADVPGGSMNQGPADRASGPADVPGS